MKISKPSLYLFIALATSSAHAFTMPKPTTTTPQVQMMQNSLRSPSLTALQVTPAEQQETDDEIERLKSMAQKLRAEAAALEAERADELAIAAEKAFQKFDTNQDGEISFDELKQGLEKILKTE